MSSRLGLVICRGLLVTLGVAVLPACEKRADEGSNAATTGSKEPVVVARPVPSLFSAPWSQAYRLQLTARSELPGQAEPSAMSVSGVLWLSSGADAGTSVLHAVVSEPTGLVNGRVEPAFGELVGQMARGATFRFQAGVLRSISVPDVAPEVANFWRTIASSLQHSGNGLASGEWKTREFDSTGEYEASYRWEADALVRRKLTYLSVLQSGTELATLEQLQPTLVSAEARLQLAGSRVGSLTSREVVRANLQKGVTMTVTTDLALTGAPGTSPMPEAATRSLASLGAAKLQVLPSDRPLALRSKGADRAQFDELKMKDWTFERAVQEVARAGTFEGEGVESNDERKEVYSAFSALTAYLRSRPDTLPKAKRIVLTGAPAAPSVVSALGMAATQNAQALLLEIALNRTVASELRSRAIVGVTQMDDPNEGVGRALVPLLDEENLWTQTVLGLGALGRRLRDAGRAEEFAEISRILEAQLTRYAKNSRVTKVLSAVSNLGDARLLPVVRPFFTAPEERVRAEAVFALRHMQTPEVDPIIAAALVAKASRATRLMVLSAVRVRGPLPVHREALRSLLAEQDLDEQVRNRATELEASWSRVATN